MTAAFHYRVKTATATWTPTGGTAVVLTGVQSIRFGEGGDVVDLVSDASELVQEQPLVNIKGRIAIQLLNQGQMDLVLGAGALTFSIERVKSGRSAVATSARPVTFANCVLKDKDGGVGTNPGESMSLQIEAADNGSGATFTVGVAA